MNRVRRFRAQIGASTSLLDELPPRPRGMHRVRYRRIVEEIEREEIRIFEDIELQ